LLIIFFLQVTYSVASGNGSSLFKVNEQTGVVSVKGSLTDLRDRNYLLILKATDKGQPPQSGMATVILSITDINRYAPEFRNSIFSKTVS
jgi:hypothetical protein